LTELKTAGRLVSYY